MCQFFSLLLSFGWSSSSRIESQYSLSFSFKFFLSAARWSIWKRIHCKWIIAVFEYWNSLYDFYLYMYIQIDSHTSSSLIIIMISLSSIITSYQFSICWTIRKLTLTKINFNLKWNFLTCDTLTIFIVRLGPLGDIGAKKSGVGIQVISILLVCVNSWNRIRCKGSMRWLMGKGRKLASLASNTCTYTARIIDAKWENKTIISRHAKSEVTGENNTEER